MQTLKTVRAAHLVSTINIDALPVLRADTPTALESFRSTEAFSNSIVYPDGSVLVVPDLHFKANCEKADLGDLWSEQECEMIFGSWTYDGLALNVSFYGDQEGLEMDNYYENSQVQVGNHPRFSIFNFEVLDCLGENTTVPLHFGLD